MPKRTKSTIKQGIPPPPTQRIWLPASNPEKSATPRDVSPFADVLADAVHSFFEHLTTSKGHGGGGVTAARPVKGQWTVVAGFVVVEDTEETGLRRGLEYAGEEVAVCGGDEQGVDEEGGKWVNMRICSLASGVKCLGGSISTDGSLSPSQQPPVESNTTPLHEPPIPNTQVSQEVPRKWSGRDAQLVDMHAEILARRELECLLVREMRVLIAQYEGRGSDADGNGQGEEQGEPMVLELVVPPSHDKRNWEDGSAALVDTQKQRHSFRMKPSTQLFLYTSHAPCGAASDAAHLRRLDAEDRTVLSLLGQLQLDPVTSEVSAFREAKSRDVPPVVKKPSRADAQPTTAFSCSDKLGRAQWLGFQGGRLATFLEGVGGPVRVRGMVVGEDFEDECLNKIFGRGAGYSRLGEVAGVLAGRAESSGRRWLEGLIMDEPCRIWETSSRFAYGRQAATPVNASTPQVPPDVEWEKIRLLPLPILRDILLPPNVGPSPFPVALAWHAHSVPQAIGPNGRLSGVTRDKKIKVWGENSVARVARGRMWDAFDELVRGYEAAFGPLGGDRRRKGGPGWMEASVWMEEKGPYAGWHAKP